MIVDHNIFCAIILMFFKVTGRAYFGKYCQLFSISLTTSFVIPRSTSKLTLYRPGEARPESETQILGRNISLTYGYFPVQIIENKGTCLPKSENSVN